MAKTRTRPKIDEMHRTAAIHYLKTGDMVEALRVAKYKYRDDHELRRQAKGILEVPRFLAVLHDEAWQYYRSVCWRVSQDELKASAITGAKAILESLPPLPPPPPKRDKSSPDDKPEYW